MEIKDWQSFTTALVIFILGAVMISLIFPIQDRVHTRQIYDYKTQQTIQEPTTNLISIYILGLWCIACLIYLASASTPSNITRIRTWSEIERDYEVQDLLARHHVQYDSPRQHEDIIGQYSIGYLGYIERRGTHGQSVAMVAVMNHDHKTTKTRPQFPCAIIAASQHQYEIMKLKKLMVPSERANLESQLERVLRAFEKKPEPIQQLLSSNAQERIAQENKEPS